MPEIMTSSYSHPWALVKWGGQQDGKRPPTRLGFITEAIAKQGEIVGYRVRTTSNGSTWTKTATLYPPTAIIKTWMGRPAEAEIKRVKSALQPTKR